MSFGTRTARVLAVVGVAGLLVVGWLVGRSLTAGGPVHQLTAGAPVELHLTGGEVLIGLLVSEGDDYLRIARPARLVAPSVGPSASGGTWSALMLANDPFAIAGDIFVPRAQITFLGAVDPESPLAGAYRQALGERPLPSVQSAPPSG